LGSFATLRLGPLEIWSSKNEFQTYHSALFQDSDLKARARVESFSTRAYLVKDRLELLGYTLRRAKQEYENPSPFLENDPLPFKFSRVLKLLKAADVGRVTNKYGEKPVQGIFTPASVQARIKSKYHPESSSVHHWDLLALLEHFEPYTTLRVLCECPGNLNVPVTWDFDDVVQGGWAERKDFGAGLSEKQRFLIVTEGSSDALILKKALQLLRPHVADFFRFVDMNEGYPFTGTGNLVNFVKGLISIGVQNDMVVLFDNDVEGVLNLNKCLKLNIPRNMRVIRLPDMRAFARFNAVGPGGKHRADINGCGAAIECYLDLGSSPVIRWTNFNDALGRYHGSLVNKDNYKRAFLAQRQRDPRYDYSKLEAVLDLIIAQCTGMRENLPKGS
jgi:HEPN/Toprim N-terminal domain 1